MRAEVHSHDEDSSSNSRTVVLRGTIVTIVMKLKMNLKSAVHFTKLSVYLAWTWPPPRNASKWEIKMYDIAWMLSCINVMGLLLPLIAAIYVHQSDSVIITQTTCFICGGFNYMIKALLYRLRQKQMQILINEMEDTIKDPHVEEKRTFQYYLDRCGIFHVVITFLNYVAAIGLISGPLFFPQPLPTHAVYPFPVNSGFTKYFAYVHQTVVGLQFSACLAVDCQIGLLMWYAAAKLEILARELKDVRNVKQFSSFVQKHQKLLSYAEDASDTMSYTALTTSALCGLGIVMSSMQLVNNETVAIKVLYGPMILICVLNLFTCAWPAENLLQTSDLMATAVYNTPWIDMPADLAKNLQFLLQRCQRPVRVSIGGFLPTLSMQFYALFLTTAFSYFTTLRAVVAVNTKSQLS